MKYLSKFSLLLLVLCTVVGSGFAHDAEAAWSDTSVQVPYSMEDNEAQWNGIGLDRIWFDDLAGTISLSLRKQFDFVRGDSSVLSLSDTVNVGDSIMAKESNTSGTWEMAGQRFSLNGQQPFFKKQSATYVGIGQFLLYATGQTTSAADSGTVEIKSQNSNVLECTAAGCVARAPGTAQVTVSFRSAQQSSYGQLTLEHGQSIYRRTKFGLSGTENKTVSVLGQPFYGTSVGYGKVGVAVQMDTTRSGGDETGNMRTLAYSFPDIVYTVTVGGTNAPHTVKYQRADDVTQSAATISWTYADPENDPQTNYQVQIATDGSFSNIIQAVTGPGGDVSQTRSARVTGLSGSDTYYARVRGYNDINGWSAWSSGSFSLDDCTSGDCDNGGGGLTIACSADTVALGGSATFKSRVSGASGSVSYEWRNTNGSGKPVGGVLGTDPDFTQRYSANGQYQMHLTVKDGSKTKETTCFVTVSDTDCGPKPSSAPSCGTAWSCSNGAWREVSDPSSPNVCTVPAVVTSYELNPNIVPIGQSCKLSLMAENVASCRLVRNGIETVAPIPGPSINTAYTHPVSVGTHTLECKDLLGVAKTYGARTCASNPEIKED